MTLDPELEGAALRLLALRDHSRRELAAKLHRRGYAPDAVASLLEELVAKGLLCEARLAEHYVAERLRKGFGPLRVREELHRKGLPDEVIDPHLRLSDDRWRELITMAHDKRFGPAKSQDPREQARRGRFLESRGFPVGLIRSLLFDDQ
ncbi:regulatory protein RecX [Thioalkalicoccus limnaeus]|uniref:Regulatory protein RecX n=1 Tax=Thioalkalicoccus limnaeus TaxID=120681 RepID=A0ABV4BET3_9GAMM